MKAAKYGPESIGVDLRGRHGNHARGAANGRWNEGRMLSSHGYVLVRVGAGHPLAFGNGYAYEHDIVWVAANGPLGPGELVHHKNEDKTDNRLENLERLTASEHGRHHAMTRVREEDGSFAMELPA
jgi:hypothetical protein